MDARETVYASVMLVVGVSVKARELLGQSAGCKVIVLPVELEGNANTPVVIFGSEDKGLTGRAPESKRRFILF